MGKLLGASLACFGIGVFVLPAGIVASSFVAEVSTNETNLTSRVTESFESELISNKGHSFDQQQHNFNQSLKQIQEDAKLLRYCLKTAQQELGELDSGHDEITSWAMFLYAQAKQESELVVSGD